MKPIYLTGFTTSVAVVGRYFKLISSSGTVSCDFQFEDGLTLKTDLVQGLGMRFERPFTKVWMHSDIDQKAMIWAGHAELTDDRSETTVAGSSALRNDSIELSAGTLTKIVSHVLGRRSALLQSDTVFSVGGANLTVENGIRVDGSIEIDTTAEIYALATQDCTVKIMSEVN